MNKNNKMLDETLNNKRYSHLKDDVYKYYSNCLNIKLGLFLKQLKDNNDLFYKKFLNKYGDAIYSKFKIVDAAMLSKKGLYIYTINDAIKYIGRCLDEFGKRINNGYGRISPKNCYLDGQSTNCHINSLITKHKEHIHLFILQLQSDAVIKRLEKDFIKMYNPEWNMQL
jgi:hypothetical protein